MYGRVILGYPCTLLLSLTLIICFCILNVSPSLPQLNPFTSLYEQCISESLGFFCFTLLYFFALCFIMFMFVIQAPYLMHLTQPINIFIVMATRTYTIQILRKAALISMKVKNNSNYKKNPNSSCVISIFFSD